MFDIKRRIIFLQCLRTALASLKSFYALRSSRYHAVCPFVRERIEISVRKVNKRPLFAI